MTAKKVIPIRIGSGASGTGASPRSETRAPTRAEVEALIQKARELALKSPQKAASVLTGWIKQAVISKKRAG